MTPADATHCLFYYSKCFIQVALAEIVFDVDEIGKRTVTRFTIRS